MIDRDNRYKGFTTSEKMTADKIVSFLDEISFNLKMDTFVVLDNASVHPNKKIRELRPIGTKGTLPFLSATILATVEHCRDTVEHTQRQVDETTGLYNF